MHVRRLDVFYLLGWNPELNVNKYMSISLHEDYSVKPPKFEVRVGEGQSEPILVEGPEGVRHALQTDPKPTKAWPFDTLGEAQGFHDRKCTEAISTGHKYMPTKPPTPYDLEVSPVITARPS